MPDKHALLSPSASSRWLTCAPSARVEAALGVESSSFFTREGTLAHALAEAELKARLFFHNTDTPKPEGYIDALAPSLAETIIPDKEERSRINLNEMIDYVTTYVDEVWDTYLGVLTESPGALLFVEAELNFGNYILEGFGTSDAVIIGGGHLYVFDLKYGRGIRVSAKHNSQMMIYALGAYLGPAELYDITTITMTIVQPRLDSISSYTISSQALFDWANNVLRPGALLAAAGKGDFNPGEHCRFCKAVSTCKALGDLAKSVNTSVPAEFLDDAQIAELLDLAPVVKSYFSALEGFALNRAIAGQPVRGWKAVEGRSVRTISDADGALEALLAAGFSRDDVTEVKLKNITTLSSLLGKKVAEQILQPFITKPKGSPTLVRASDPRPEYTNGADDAFKGVEA